MGGVSGGVLTQACSLSPTQKRVGAVLTTLGQRKGYADDDFDEDGNRTRPLPPQLPPRPSNNGTNGQQVPSPPKTAEPIRHESRFKGVQRIPHVHLCKFDHVPGSKVCQHLYGHYELPDGSLVHYYHRDDMQEKVVGLRIAPPPVPITLDSVFRDSLPEAPPRVQPERGTDEVRPFRPEPVSAVPPPQTSWDTQEAHDKEVREHWRRAVYWRRAHLLSPRLPPAAAANRHRPKQNGRPAGGGEKQEASVDSAQLHLQGSSAPKRRPRSVHTPEPSVSQLH